MAETFWLVLKLGFPLLWVVMTLMALGAIWTDKRKAQNRKWVWSLVVVLLPVVGVGIYLFYGYR